MQLEEFLAQVRSEGRQESSGQFTIDLARTLEKLREHQLRQPAAYLMRLLQSAVGIGARSLSITIERGRTVASFSLEACGRYGYLQEILEKLGNPFPPDNPAGHLTRALQSAMALDPPRLRWRLENGEREELLEFSGQKLQVTRKLKPDPQAGKPSLFRLEFERRWSWMGLLSRGSWSDEHAIIARHGRQAPLRLVIDGRAVEPFALFEEGVRALLLVTAPPRGLESGFLVPAPEPGLCSKLKIEDHRGNPRTARAGQMLRCQYLLAHYAGGDRKAWLEWFKEGLHVGVDMHQALGVADVEAFCACGRLSTDLSGLAAVEDEIYAQQVSRLKSLAQRLKAL